MKNFVHPGKVMPFTAPSGGITSGAGVKVGSIFGVAVADAAANETMQIQCGGVFNLPKLEAQAWTEGQKLYWDETNKHVTSTASGNTHIGCAAAVAANPSTTGTVRLHGNSV